MSAEQLPIPEHSTQEVQRELSEILAHEEFSPRPKPLAEIVVEWIDERIESLTKPATRPFVGDISTLDLAAVVLLVILVALVIRRVRATLRSSARRHLESNEIATTRISGRAWRQEAEEHEQTGEWRQAMRCRYRALLAELVERRVVEDVVGRTTGEYRMEANKHDHLLDAPFTEASTLFEAAWYGNETTGPDEASRFQDLADEVVGLVGASNRGVSPPS